MVKYMNSFQGEKVVIDDENESYVKRDSYISLIKKTVSFSSKCVKPLPVNLLIASSKTE